MARIRHIAIATQDVDGTKRFYIEGLGLKEVGQTNSGLADGVYLSDGHVNIAILNFKDDNVATTEGAPRHTGIHHLGFGVDNMEQAQQQIIAAGATAHLVEEVASANQLRTNNVEVKFTGPDGVTVDLSEAGWMGTGD
jgi:methylmalonyl-CoA/ethylmalonyl-CoA epimerase